MTVWLPAHGQGPTCASPGHRGYGHSTAARAARDQGRLGTGGLAPERACPPAGPDTSHQPGASSPVAPPHGRALGPLARSLLTRVPAGSPGLASGPSSPVAMQLDRGPRAGSRRGPARRASAGRPFSPSSASFWHGAHRKSAVTGTNNRRLGDLRLHVFPASQPLGSGIQAGFSWASCLGGSPGLHRVSGGSTGVWKETAENQRWRDMLRA